MTQNEFLEGLYTTGKVSVDANELRQVLQKNINLIKENKGLQNELSKTNDELKYWINKAQSLRLKQPLYINLEV